MKVKKGKVLKIIGSVIIILIMGGFLLNWYLQTRLEGFLREQLSQRIAEATDGFYKFESEKLNVGFFNGELTLRGVELKPDSAILNDWASKDSLPLNYFDIQIDKIHFKGLNLIWLLSYRQLHFDLFEIQKPTVKIYESGHLAYLEEKEDKPRIQTLHEIISPYIDIITVDKMNLEHASVSYVSDNNNGMYGLTDASFHGYNFVLDENSAQSGKLFYFDNFSFSTNQPQVLLSNNQFLLEIDHIELNTKDSIVRINDIHLKPQTLLWKEHQTYPDAYLDARVKTIEMKGMHFKRKDALNYLEARLFGVKGSDIQYYNLKQDSVRLESKDTLNLSWTLYEVLSPILHSTSIDKIGIQSAKLEYINSSKKGLDVYTLDRFNFEAYGFKVDSLADIQRRFLYSEGFLLDATNIEAILVSRNHSINIGRMNLNTEIKNFQIKNIKLAPLSLKTNRDYISGAIDSISLLGLEYDKGLIAEQLTIDAPKVEYVKKKNRRPQKDSVQSNVVNLDAVTPFFNHIFIAQVNLNRGNIIFKDKSNLNNMIYRLPRIDFSASNFLIDAKTIEESLTYFTSDDIRFSFERFDNVLPSKDYRLVIRKGLYTGLGGNVELHDVKLLPQVDSWKKAPNTYFSLLTPFVAIRNINHGKSLSKSTLVFNSLNLDSPHVEIVKTADSPHKVGTNSIFQNINIMADLFDVKDADIKYFDKVLKDSLITKFEDLQLKSLSWDAEMKKGSIGSIFLESPFVNLHQSREKESSAHQKKAEESFLHLIDIGQVDISNIRMGVDQPNLKLNFSTGNLGLKHLEWGSDKFHMESVNIVKPKVTINHILETNRKKPSKVNTLDIYSAFKNIAKQVSVDHFNISDANIDYSSTLNEVLNQQQRLNTTSFSFTGLWVNSDTRKFGLDDINFSTNNFRLPLDGGFYTLEVGSVDLKKNKGRLLVKDIHLVPAYSKTEFAYHHPTNKDWFDVSVGGVSLLGIDFDRFVSNNVLDVKDLSIKNVSLLNYKNQKIEIQHNIMPMIYEMWQKAPIQFVVDTANVENFNVVYEELTKKGTEPGKIFFTNINQKLSGLTNIVSDHKQYIQLKGDGRFMGTGHFNSTWLLPVDSLNDHFYLKVNLGRFDLKELNQLITPMAPIKINRGVVNSVTFSTNASSKGASVDLLMMYNDLNVSVLRNKDGEVSKNSFVTTLANKVIKKNNPDRKRKKPRQPHAVIERDAYHSTFNYLWQILQPPVIESVGFSQKNQSFVKKVSGFFNKVKGLFNRDMSKELEFEDSEE